MYVVLAVRHQDSEVHAVALLVFAVHHNGWKDILRKKDQDKKVIINDQIQFIFCRFFHIKDHFSFFYSNEIKIQTENLISQAKNMRKRIILISDSIVSAFRNQDPS